MLQNYFEEREGWRSRRTASAWDPMLLIGISISYKKGKEGKNNSKLEKERSGARKGMNWRGLSWGMDVWVQAKTMAWRASAARRAKGKG